MEKPNIIFILADDLGQWGLGCYGNHEIHTPNIDRLAKEGVLFENFFCTSPVCSPARASILTGKMPSAHGVHDWIRGGNTGQKSKVESQKPGKGTDQSEYGYQYLKGQRTWTEVLAENGYRLGISGKWHLGASGLKQCGFEYWKVTPWGGDRYINARMCNGDEIYETEGYITDVITDNALDFLKQSETDERPFCLHVNYTAPHSPWVDQHPDEYIRMYEDCTFETCPQEELEERFQTANAQIQFSEMYASEKRKNRGPIPVEEHLRGYFASVTAMDTQIGRIMNYLESTGLKNDSLVIFMGDNGFNCGHHGIWGKGSGTFPLNLYDTSVIVPAVFRYPERFASDVRSTGLFSQYDIFPTIMALSGIEEETEEKRPGRSFLRMLEDEDDTDPDDFVVIYDEYGPNRMIRNSRWKYIHRYLTGLHELYDLEMDPGEKLNLLEDNIQQGRNTPEYELHRKLEQWFEEYSVSEFDGRILPVSGRGQLLPLSCGGPEENLFHPFEKKAY